VINISSQWKTVSKSKKLNVMQSYIFIEVLSHTATKGDQITLSVSKHNMMGTYSNAHASVDKCFELELERKKDKAKNHIKLRVVAVYDQDKA
jgi:hypothetical protein